MIKRLLHEERKKLDKRKKLDRTTGSGQNHEGAMTAKNCPNKKRGPRCYNCQKVGHVQRNSPLATHIDERDRKLVGRRDKHRVHQVEAKEISGDSESDVGLLVTRHELNSVL